MILVILWLTGKMGGGPPGARPLPSAVRSRSQTGTISLIKRGPVQYTGRSDVWLRYHDERDVRRWGEFIAEVLPAAVSRIAATHNA